MLIYIDDNRCSGTRKESDSRPTNCQEGSSADSRKPRNHQKDDSNERIDIFCETQEKMKSVIEDGSHVPASNLMDCLQVWRYHDFMFEQIGEGFFGTVFKVTHKTTKKVLVLKEMKKATDEDHKAMFAEEIRTLSRLCHPNVLRCEGLAMHGENLCLLTEYVDGGSLDELLVKRSPLLHNWEARLNVSMEIARGMAYLHSAGVIHRDLASKNILIRQSKNGMLQGIVADLGLSYTISDLLGDEEYVLETVGSPFHMAPEVMNHKPYNTKADIFSYGIILCEMITMCPGADPDDVPRTNDFGLAVEDFSEMASDCPSKLLDLTVRCCQVNPKERPSFDNIVKALDIMLDKMVDSDEDVLNCSSSEELRSDYVIENSLICTCNFSNDGNLNEDALGIKESTDRFGSVHKTGSRRLLKRHLPRCSACGGRVWRLAGQDQPEIRTHDPKHGDYYHCTAPAQNQQILSTSEKEFSPGKLLDDSQEIFTVHLTQLAENTPGKLPRFFQNLLRSKRSKIRPRDSKRRWRKSFHDIFSLHSNQHDGREVCIDNGVDSANAKGSGGEGAASKNVDPANPSASFDQHRCKSNKHDKTRLTSKARKKSEHRPDKDGEKEMSDDTHKTRESCEIRSSDADSCTVVGDHNGSPSISRHPFLQPLGHFVALSVDSLDKLDLSDDRKQRNRRYSIPSRKARHGRTKSSDAADTPLRKQSSGSSKILNFLRRKSQASPRD